MLYVLLHKIRSMRLFFILILSVVGMTSITAQKFGHINSMKLLQLLPEIEKADSVLILYQNELVADGDSMVQAFKTKYDAYVKDAQAGSMSKIQSQTREAQLTQEQQDIQNYEKQAQNQIIQKRQELYEPILNRVDETIKAIGEEDAYSMIFDTSNQSFVFITESEDITQKVMNRLYK